MWKGHKTVTSHVFIGGGLLSLESVDSHVVLWGWVSLGAELLV